MYPDKHNVKSHIQDTAAVVTYRLIWNIELVFERLTWYDGTLIHKGSAIVSVIAVHVNTVPMLQVDISSVASSRHEMLTTDVATSMVVS
jgi:hypothetical protein